MRKRFLYAGIYFLSLAAATAAGSIISDRYWAEVVQVQKQIIDQQHHVFAVREQMLEIGYNDRLANLLHNIDMECFGRWTTADGAIELGPDGLKVAVE